MPLLQMNPCKNGFKIFFRTNFNGTSQVEFLPFGIFQPSSSPSSSPSSRTKSSSNSGFSNILSLLLSSASMFSERARLGGRGMRLYGSGVFVYGGSNPGSATTAERSPSASSVLTDG